MQALVVVLDDQLPVRAHVVDDAVAEAEILHAPRAEPGGKRAELRLERRGLRIEIDEDVPVPQRGADPVQRVVGLAEVRHFVHVRRADQAAVEVVGPGVIRALDAAGERAVRLGAQLRAAVPADVVERVDGGRAAGDDDPLAEQLADEEVSRVPDLLGAPGAHPHAREQPLHLAVEARPVDVVARRQRARVLRHDVTRLDLGCGHAA